MRISLLNSIVEDAKKRITEDKNCEEIEEESISFILDNKRKDEEDMKRCIMGERFEFIIISIYSKYYKYNYALYYKFIEQLSTFEYEYIYTYQK